MRTRLTLLLLLQGMTATLAAQRTAPPPGAAVQSAPKEATQFDFLVGQWELTVTPKAAGLAQMIHGAPRYVGTWKAWKAFDGLGIEDELRVLDRSGNPAALTVTMRVWSSTERRWVTTSVDAYRGRTAPATARWVNGEMLVDGQTVDPAGAAVLTRSRFTGIAPGRFRFVQDRSTDGGKTWTTGAMTIEATRVAATAPR
ncbi:MAG: hypothetical protein MUF00_03710 [Gemmatimonadaceae bacterium]|jgi:hypothetical protein|nr:hypothetical protein [Gemmatimonadaceae bacterium]